MATGRSTRESQVRRRPPSTGRPAPARGRPRAPIAGSAWRTPPTRRAESRSGVTILVKFLLGFAVIAFSAAIVLAGTGILSRAVSGIGTSLAGFIGQTQPPSAGPIRRPAPRRPRVRDARDHLHARTTRSTCPGSVPASVAGRTGYTVSSPAASAGRRPVDLASVPVGPTTVFGVEKVPLKVGVNVLTARIEGPAGDSPEGPQIYVDRGPEAPVGEDHLAGEGATVNGPRRA